MPGEKCAQCGFDGDTWSDADALECVAGLPASFVEPLAGLAPEDAERRPVAGSWSIAEYTDHVREVLFGMRFLLDTALTESGRDLGPAPPSRFDPEPSVIDLDRALAGLDREATSLARRLRPLAPDQWTSTVIMDGDEKDPSWIVRHAVHDATHHLLDIERLRAAL